MSRYQFIRQVLPAEPVQELCRGLLSVAELSNAPDARLGARLGMPDAHQKSSARASDRRPGIPYDNAQAETGWRTLETALLLNSSAFASLEEARLEVAYYLDTYINLDRRCFALGYRSPH